MFGSLVQSSDSKTNGSEPAKPQSARWQILDDFLSQNTLPKVPTPEASPDVARPETTLDKMSRELPGYVAEAKEHAKSPLASFFPFRVATKLWGLWERFSNFAPSPWNSVCKYGVPLIAATGCMVFYHAFIQIGVDVVKFCAGCIQPLAITAGLLIPAFSAGSIMNWVENTFKLEHLTGWKRQAILWPVRGGLLVGAAIWTQTLGLNMLTYSLWAGAAVGAGILATKLSRVPARTIWAAVATAAVLPWSHYATQRTFDITVLSAGPDPEVAAWNIGTDLSVTDHWKELTFLGSQKPPSGHNGMVFINRDVPLYLPPHRTANSFNADFTNLVGKQVRVTTIGGWLKFLSPKLQPTIVKYEVINNGAGGLNLKPLD